MSPKVSPAVAECYAADLELAAGYEAGCAAAENAERALRHAQAQGLPHGEVRALATAFDRGLLHVLAAAAATERVEMGPATYVDPNADAAVRRKAEIAARKARARTDVRPWSAEVERLRTLRERHRLTFRTEA